VGGAKYIFKYVMPPKSVYQRSQAVVKQGSMLKRGWWASGYKERWFVLQQNTLYYFVENPATKPGLQPKGFINIDKTSKIEHSPTDKAVLLIKNPDRLWELRTGSIDAAGRWFEKLVLAQRGEFVYDDESAVLEQTAVSLASVDVVPHAAADAIGEASSVPAPAAMMVVDERTGVEFRILPNDLQPMV
jgi:hypothetical protein